MRGSTADLMATKVKAHWILTGFAGARQRFPLYSRDECPGSDGVAISARDLAVVPWPRREGFRFCFPSFQMVGVIVQHLEESCAHAVVVMPKCVRRVAHGDDQQGDEVLPR